jgi:TM2 domain-containing membrane protein YozV
MTGSLLKILAIAIFLLCAGSAIAGRVQTVVVFRDSAAVHEAAAQYEQAGISEDSPNPFFKTLFKIRKGQTRSKTIAAALAFPLTGITGIHRIYLGTKPYVPVVYIGTAGGCFGILPFIDFVVILVEKDISRYENNSKLFMWVDQPGKPAVNTVPTGP